MSHIETLKKIAVLIVAALCVTLVYVKDTLADNSEGYLYWIMQFTNQTANSVQNLYNLTYQNTVGSESMNGKDDGSDGTQSKFAQTQDLFYRFGKGYVDSRNLQNDKGEVKRLFADQLGVSAGDLGVDGLMNGKILNALPNANEYAYSTTLGIPPVSGGGTDVYNYVKNAAGFNIVHPVPDKSWQGKDADIDTYKRYFYTITAIQSFNSYILNQIQTDARANKDSTSLQNQLVAMASDNNWLAQVASQSMGKVYRQILLFESQNYVINTQIQQYQRQLLEAQAMTNSLLILFNQQNESQLVRRAKGLGAGF